ncbi:MAG: hypothetical protein PHR36_00620 [Patescibacteria group bacterium]|nr:hypothetical protein [Patescibacteria group bacterium]
MGAAGGQGGLGGPAEMGTGENIGYAPGIGHETLRLEAGKSVLAGLLARLIGVSTNL